MYAERKRSHGRHLRVVLQSCRSAGFSLETLPGMRKSRPPLFKWRHFEPALITCALVWYLRFSLSYRYVEDLLAERCLSPTVAARKLKPANCSWRVDETYFRVKRKWTYLYRAVDSLTASSGIPGHPGPRVINVDGNPAYPKVVAELKQGANLTVVAAAARVLT